MPYEATPLTPPGLFRQFQCEVRRIHLPRTRVNRSKKKGRGCYTPRPFVRDLCAYPSAARTLLRSSTCPLPISSLWASDSYR
jgi:hypothetical protein